MISGVETEVVVSLPPAMVASVFPGVCAPACVPFSTNWPQLVLAAYELPQRWELEDNLPPAHV